MGDDTIDISDFNLDNDWTSSSSSKPSYGGGLELLMNTKKSKSSNSSSNDIDINDLNDLENELNELSDREPITNHYESGLFGSGSGSGSGSDSFRDDDRQSVRFNDEASIHILDNNNLGQSTANTATEAKTWDGYGKFNNVPINPDQRMSMEPKMSKDETLREKYKYLRKLEGLEKKGVELTKKYNMDSNLQEMIGEYETVMEEKTKQNAVKFQGQMMMAMINGMEFLNNRFDPFDIKLDGWGEQINENITDYDDIFSELHDKYKSKATMSPELKLLFQLGGSAMMVHMSNTMFKSSMPGMDDVLRQNPELMRQFQTAAVNSMADKNPGLSGFMSGIMGPGQQQGHQGQGPPPPMATQGLNGLQPPPNRAGNNVSMSQGQQGVRSDISMARGAFTQQSQQQPPSYQKSARRPDMKGPGDISDILSGLKVKTIDIATTSKNYSPKEDADNNSIISIDDLKSIQGSVNMPKRSYRKGKSDKNTLSLDI